MLGLCAYTSLNYCAALLKDLLELHLCLPELHCSIMWCSTKNGFLKINMLKDMLSKS